MAYFFILSGALLRLVSHFNDLPIVSEIAKFIPHLPNFAPIAAMALFGGVYLNKKYALIIPLAALFLSDLLIGFYNPYLMIAVYGSFILIGLIGLWLKNHKTLPNVIGASLFGSIIFFLITNFAMWAIQRFMPQPIYPQTLQGLLSSFMMGLPFFRNTILGDLFYSGVFFGLMETAVWFANKYVKKEEGNGISLNRMARKRL